MSGRLWAAGVAAGVVALRVRRERREAAARSVRAYERAWLRHAEDSDAMHRELHGR